MSRRDNTFAGARTLRFDRTIRDSVGQGDRIDVYKFRASSSGNFSLSLSGLRGNANVKLLNGRRRTIAASNQPRNGREQIRANLEAGTYYLQVQYVDRRGATSYNLRSTLTATPSPNPVPTPTPLPDPNRTLTGTIGIDNLVGGSGNDRLSGLNGNDTLTGNLGNDRLEGGAGSDTYNFRRGDGQDILDEESNDIGLDSLVFSGDGLTSGNVVVTREGTTTNLKLSFGGGITDSVVLDEQLFGGFSTNYGIESITFSDGVVWSEAQLWNAYLTLGASTNDTLTGTGNGDNIIGGLGNDLLVGGAGSDTYSFRRGDGQDILDEESNDIGLDSLVFSGDGLTSGNVVVTQVGTSTDLRLTFGGGITDSVVLDEQLFGGISANYGIESITFSDGVTWNETQLRNAIQ